MTAWYTSRFPVCSARSGNSARPHDPDVFVWSGKLPHWGLDGRDLATGGAGWNATAAEMAGVGEAIDAGSRSRYRRIRRSNPPFKIGRSTNPRSNRGAGFCFMRSSTAARISISAFHEGESLPLGLLPSCADWRTLLAPEEFVFLAPRPGKRHQFGPAISTGLSCGREGDPILLRGLQEVLERDALVARGGDGINWKNTNPDEFSPWWGNISYRDCIGQAFATAAIAWLRRSAITSPLPHWKARTARGSVLVLVRHAGKRRRIAGASRCWKPFRDVITCGSSRRKTRMVVCSSNRQTTSRSTRCITAIIPKCVISRFWNERHPTLARKS